jgi:uncharacterized membrane protein
MTPRHLLLLTASLAVIGVAIAGYLTWVHYADIEPICAGGGGGCEKVQTSSYAELAGVPVALIGLIGYLAILGSLLVPGEAGRMGGALLALAGFGFSAYLTYLELFEIEASRAPRGTRNAVTELSTCPRTGRSATVLRTGVLSVPAGSGRPRSS